MLPLLKQTLLYSDIQGILLQKQEMKQREALFLVNSNTYIVNVSTNQQVTMTFYDSLRP